MKDDCDFSLQHYKTILKTAVDSGYQFVSYDELETANTESCVLRHDVDYVPLRTLEFAEIERDLGIRSYYFFLISCELYNIRDKRVYEVLHELKRMSHYVGLHVDLSWVSDNGSSESILAQCNEERKLFTGLTDIEPCEIISFHNPGKCKELVLNKEIAGLKHTYEDRYFSNVKYLSDSQGWYEGCVCKIFEEKRYKKMQLLTHPYIWSVQPKGEYVEDIAQMVKSKQNEITEYVVKDNTISSNNEERIRSLIKSAE